MTRAPLIRSGAAEAQSDFPRLSRTARMNASVSTARLFSALESRNRSFVITPSSMVRIAAASKLVGKRSQRRAAVQLAALAQRARQANSVAIEFVEVCCPLQVGVIMALHGAVRRLVFILAVRRDEHTGHHRQRTERGRDHVAHHVTVVVLARPDKAALRPDHARNCIVDERVEVFDALLRKLFPYTPPRRSPQRCP